MKCYLYHASFQSVWLIILFVGAELQFSWSFSLPTSSRRFGKNVSLKVSTSEIPSSESPRVSRKVSSSEPPKVSVKASSSESPNVGGLLAYDVDGYPRLNSLRKALPQEIFKVSSAKSLFYFAADTTACVLSIGFLYAVVTSDIYRSLAVWKQALTVAPLQLLAGFAMWCQWCIGHDAGHQLISKKFKWLNTAVGEIAHSVFCLTPYVPWQKSHKRHHTFHNHLERDYSHQWFVREQKDELDWWIKGSHATRNLHLPFLYFVYLCLGVPDGGHVIPFYGRLWEGQPLKSKLRGLLSSCISVLTAGTLWAKMGFADFTVVCMVPWCVMSFWLFMVTYLQHHSDDGKLYTDKTHSFVKGAFETVDRSYGKWTNRLSHHMMDGHVMHHLFFEKVPHYNLEHGTRAMQKLLQKEGKIDLYKSIQTEEYAQEIVKQFNNNWFFVDEKQIVRE
mmetsp:Transcript_15804/g.36591  ORF Transcript_15804/g.36591 Transcript_15804/m.36591 type:complete len:447 (+) Transcript_15804:110-1450(+)